MPLLDVQCLLYACTEDWSKYYIFLHVSPLNHEVKLYYVLVPHGFLPLFHKRQKGKGNCNQILDKFFNEYWTHPVR